MTILQPVKPGLSAPVVTSIPDQWSKAWFRSFITNYLQNSDVRNATTGNGIDVSSTNFTQPATISLSSIAHNTVLGNIEAGSNPPQALTQAQLTALINTFTVSTSGAVPAAPVQDPTLFLNAVGTFTHVPTSNIPASTGAAVVVPSWEDPDDALLIPGPAGPQGAQGNPGTGGSGGTGAVLYQDDLSEDVMFVPGQVGPKGNAGSTGATGPQAPIAYSYASEDAEDPAIVPGPVGPAGSGTSATIVTGNINFDTPVASPNSGNDEFTGTLNSAWTWFNQGTSTASTDQGYLSIEGTVGSNAIALLAQPVPTGTTWGIQAGKMFLQGPSTGGGVHGIAVYDTASGIAIVWGIWDNGGTTLILGKWATLTGGGAAIYSGSNGSVNGPTTPYYRIYFDGTNLNFQANAFGEAGWINVYSATPASFGMSGVTHVGFGVNSSSTANPMLCDWFRIGVGPFQASPPIGIYAPCLVSALPTGVSQGIRGFVTDATSTTFASTVAGGGSNKVPVVYDGTNWKIG